MSEPPRVRVHLLPALIQPGELRGGVAVVVDVLRATTSMVHALAAGAESIRPCLEVEDAFAIARDLPVGSALLTGERQGLPIPDFDLGNSPDALGSEATRGKTVVMTSTNGTRALLAAIEADRLLVGAFSNLQAILNILQAETRPIHIVGSGTDGLVSWEDTLLSGAYVEALTPPDDLIGPIDDAARIARTAWRSIDGVNGLRAALEQGRGGRRVREIGLSADFEAVAAVDRFPDLVAELLKEPIRVIASNRTG